MIRVSCTVDAQQVEDALDVLLPRLPQGVHERAAGQGRCELSWFGGGRFDAELGELARDWAEEEAPDRRDERARRYGEVLVIAERIAIRAPDSPPPPAGVPEVVIAADDAQFGTGAHPTTRDALEILVGLAPDGSFADLGCGAGVLAVTAARLGFRPVFAVDFEARSVRATAENARANGVEIDVRRVDLRYEQPPAAATVAANVPLSVHETVAGSLAREVRRVIVSGIVLAEADRALAAYAEFRISHRRDTAGWTTLLLERA